MLLVVRIASEHGEPTCKLRESHNPSVTSMLRPTREGTSYEKAADIPVGTWARSTGSHKYSAQSKGIGQEELCLRVVHDAASSAFAVF